MNKNQLHTILQQLPVGCLLLDDSANIEFLNRAAEDMLGYSLEESRGMHAAELFIAANERDRLSALLDGAARSVSTSQIFETRTKNGTVTKNKWKSTSLHTEQGGYFGKLITVEDLAGERRIEEQLNRHVQYLQALRTIDLAIAGSVDIHTVLGVILREAMKLLKMDAAVVLIYDPNLDLLKFAAGRGLQSNALEFTTLRLGEGFAGKAALLKQIVRVPNLDIQESGFIRSPNFHKEGFQSYYCTPLLSKGKVIGVLESFHKKHFTPNIEWLGYFETLGGQAAIAIENANLFTELQHSNFELSLAYDATLEGWSKALDLRDRDTEGHTRRVTELTERLAVALNIHGLELIHIRRGAILHDIGKMGIPDRILMKDGALTDEEWEIMRRHPIYAYEMLSPILYLRPALDIPYCHHERWNGSGYPRGLKGEQIPIAARIFALADVFDALTSDRPYRRAWSAQKAMSYLLAERGKQFDPAMVDLFVRVIYQSGGDFDKPIVSRSTGQINVYTANKD